MYKVDLREAMFPAQGGTVPAPMTIGALLRSAAEQWPDIHALRAVLPDGTIGRSWTFSELLKSAEDLGRALASRHPQNSRIAVYANNVPEWVLLEMGCALAGVTLVTVNPSYQQRELEYVLTQSGAEAIYYVDEFRGNPMAEIANAASENIPAIKHRIVLTDTDRLFVGFDAGVLRDVKPEDPAQIQYTSGTTGFPKGAILHHHGLVRNGVEIMRRGGLQAGSKCVHHMPLFHTTGCAALVLGGIGVGATMLLTPTFDPEIVIRLVESEAVDFLNGVPTMFVALIAEAKRSGRDVTSVTRMVSGGAMVAPELCRAAQQTFGAAIQIVYGQTEASPAITQTWYDDTLEDLTGTIGQPVPYVDVSIRDPRTNQVVGIEEQGEICCRGYNVMTGYNDNPEATAETIDEDGWLHTGDLGVMDARGYLRINGRVKEMIIRGGENLFPAEIENAILEHPGVSEVSVVGVADTKLGERVVCFLKARDGIRPSDGELRSFIRERLSPQKTPSEWLWVNDWPMTGSGKVQKFKLRDAYEAGQFNTAPANRN